MCPFYYRQAFQDLDDTIPYGAQSCRDWMSSVKYPALSKVRRIRKTESGDSAEAGILSRPTTAESEAGAVNANLKGLAAADKGAS